MSLTLPLTLLLALQTPPPTGYYDAVDDSTALTLRASLHTVIDDHTRLPYTSSSVDTHDCLEAAQQDPSATTRIVDVYRNRSFAKQGGPNSQYNREHTWPKSYGFPDNGTSNSAYTDCHMLWFCDDGYNSDRSNKPFGSCSAACAELPTDANNGTGGGSGAYPGNSNWTSGSFSNGTFEVNPIRRGDIARSLFYADVRYEGGTHNVTGFAEPDLILTNNIGLIAGSNTGQNESVAYMGRLSVLVQWHLEDPVDDFERRRNDVVAQFQGNRNPFVDHPEWADCLFAGMCMPDAGQNYCSPAVVNSTGAPATIEGRGTSLIAADDFRLIASSLPANAAGYFLCSRMAGIVFQPGGSQGNLCLGGAIGRVVGGQVLNAGFFGSFSIGVDLSALPQPTGAVPAVIGDAWHFQAWFRDVVGAPSPATSATAGSLPGADSAGATTHAGAAEAARARRGYRDR